MSKQNGNKGRRFDRAFKEEAVRLLQTSGRRRRQMRARSSCQPAPSHIMTACASWSRVSAKCARNRSMTLALTLGITRVTSSPVSGRTAEKM